MKYIMVVLIILGMASAVAAEELSLTDYPEHYLTQSARVEFIPVLYRVEHNYIAQVFDPPRLPKAGDCVVVVLYEVSDDGGMVEIKGKLEYTPCGGPTSPISSTPSYLGR